MAKPAKDIFDHWFAIETERPAEVVLHKAIKLLKGLEGRFEEQQWDKLLALLHDASAAYDVKVKEVSVSPAFKWAQSQPGYLRAKSAVGRSAERWIGQKRSSWIEAAITGVNRDDIAWTLEHALRPMLSYAPQSSWQAGLFRALHEYHYTAAAEQQFMLVKNGPIALNAMSEAINAALPFLDSMESWEHTPHMAHLRKAAAYYASANFDHLPIQRNSKNKAETLFVYRMREVNLEHSGKAKPDAIAELMTTDGFAHEFDERTIERMCARFEAAEIEAESL